MIINKELIKSCQAQKREAQKQMYDILLPYLRAVAHRYLRDTSYVKDVLQESFIKFFKNIDNYNPAIAPIEKWAAKIVVNVSLNYNDRIIKNTNQVFDNSEYKLICFPQIIKDLSDEHLLFILKQMPKEYFDVFNLFVIDGYHHDEISSLLNITSSLSRKRLSRGRQWLKKTFRDPKSAEANLISLPKKYK